VSKHQAPEGWVSLPNPVRPKSAWFAVKIHPATTAEILIEAGNNMAEKPLPEKIGWETWLPIISQYGLGVAERLWHLWSAKGEPNPEDWAVLNKLAAENSRTGMLAALARAGIPLTDPKAIALLDLVKKP